MVLISAVKVASGCIGLPDLDERVRHRPRIFIENAPAHDNALPKRFSRMLPRQIRSLHIGNIRFKHRSRNFREGVWKMHQWFERSPLERRNIRRV